ncbi:hypothetical protein SKAU_G00187020 [Synaphobranchus kaupii]|uniref:Uncharacterized protein n=1 Tax=Synaphobranchus kaupii TaxID=118154 RepID=A0A9Q1FCN7_SYNKA|nr:hypothetical protein SKAU_G00187020 [Synaphobranchus kaupii]
MAAVSSKGQFDLLVEPGVEDWRAGAEIGLVWSDLYAVTPVACRGVIKSEAVCSAEKCNPALRGRASGPLRAADGFAVAVETAPRCGACARAPRVRRPVCSVSRGACRSASPHRWAFRRETVRL